MMEESVRVPIVINEGSEAPCYAHEGDGAADLRSAIDIAIEPHGRAVVPCGASMAIPDGFAGLVMPRSGLAAKHGITVLNSPGLIDSGYRGEIKAILLNTDSEHAFYIKKGDRVAQLMLVRVPRIEFLECSDLETSERGSDGLGSSGIG